MTPDVNKPIENPKLCALLRELRDAEPQQRLARFNAVVGELAENAFLLAVIQMEDDALVPQGDGKAVFQKDSRISFPMLRAADGSSYLPVYTDWAELRKCEAYKNAQVKTLILSFDDMASISAGQKGITVNPYSDNFMLRPQDVTRIRQRRQEMAQGFSAYTVQKETTVKIGTPADYPKELAAALVRYASSGKTIRAMWLKLMEREGEKSYLVIVDFEGDRNAIFKGIGNAAAPYLKQGMFIDMVPYADSFGQKAAEGEPIYRRKRGLFRR